MQLLRSSTKRTINSLLLTHKAWKSRMPIFQQPSESDINKIYVLTDQEANSIVPPHKLQQFKDKHTTRTVQSSQKQTTSSYYNQNSWKKIEEISQDTSIQVSSDVQNHHNFLGIASEILTKAYQFSRKQKPQKTVSVTVDNIKDRQYLIELANSKIRAAQWANSRGDQATTNFMLQQATLVANKHPDIKMTVIRGQQLLEQGFRLMHAVGRASEHQPAMVNLEWKGNPDSQEYVSLVGKGVCFDSGGLNLKPSASIGGMHNDKHGACSVLSAFESAVKLNLKVNIVATIGLVQNSISANSYRPLDIIQSRKGLTVEIGNTDAEGRLVLADCMNWVQEKYKVKTMLDMATLTGAVIIALGKNRAGVFTNSDKLAKDLSQTGQQMEEWVWRLPLDQYHDQLIKSKQADITNASKKPEASSSQAAAFLKQFVEPGVQWAHLDIAGAADSNTYSTGFGAKLMLHYVRSLCK